MAVIDIKKPHTMDAEHVREAAQHLIDTLEKDFGVTYQWSGNVVDFSCAPKGISGKLTVEPSMLSLNVKLGLLASMFERTLRNEINSYLDRHVS